MPTGSSTNAIEFSFDGKNSIPDHVTLEALAVEAGAQSDPDAPTAAAPAATARPKAAAPAVIAAEAAVDADDAPVAKAAVATSSDDDVRTHKITVNGQELEVTEADLKAGHMRQLDYTQKTQKVAERERALATKEREWTDREAQYKDELQAIDQFLKSEQAIDAYRQKAFGRPLAPPQVDPNQPITAQQVADIARYNAEQVRQSTLRDMQQQANEAKAAAEQVKRTIELERLEGHIDHHIASLIDKSPLLKNYAGGDIADLSEELIGMASRFAPKTLDEAKQYLADAADRKIAVLKRISGDEQKAIAVKAALLKKTSPEPPGGAPAKTPATKKLTFDAKDRKSRIDAGIETVKAFLDANQ